MAVELKDVLEPGSKDRYLCPYCGKFLFAGHLASGSKIEVKCTRSKCRKLSEIFVL